MRLSRLLAIIISISVTLQAKSAGTADSTSNLSSAIQRVRDHVSLISGFAKANDYNSHYCILIDMSIPSGKKRLFVYNLDTDSIEHSMLVANGFGSYQEGKEELRFSNTINSGMTSLGKYSIGKSYYGNYGLSYKLHGLDSTNSNAYARTIVLHSFSQMADIEIYPRLAAFSAGCPMVSPTAFAVLNKYIKCSAKPMLMWIYN